MKHIVLLMFLLLGDLSAQAQDLGKYQWESRLLLVFARDTADLAYQMQLRWLRNCPDQLKERRIEILHYRPEAFRTGLGLASQWQASDVTFPKTETPFQVRLVGLDGGVKLKQDVPISCAELVKIIDAMPMRAAEMRRKKNE